MEDHQDNSGSAKKPSLRKKVVDLKAVAALLEESDSNRTDEGTSKQSVARTSFQPNEELIQATARVKNQRDLVKKRFQKMEQSREKVTKSVFDKVYRDYAMQLDTINKLLNEKKTQLHKELKNLYLQREKEDIDISRHKEILEEARFRHFLEEYTEEQYREVEEYESKEIQHLQNEIAQLQSYIKIHEELFDPEDLGFMPKREAKPPLTPPVLAPKAPTSQEPILPPAPPAPPPPAAFVPQPPSKQITVEWAEKTPLPEPIRESQEEPVTIEPPSIKPSSEAGEEADFLLSPPETEGYFVGEVSEPSITTTEPAPRQAPLEVKAPPVKIPEVEPTILKTPEPKPPLKEPESIFDILEEIPAEAEVSATAPKAELDTTLSPTAQTTPAPVSQAAAATAGYKLILVEGDSDISEFELKDNVSIGRSPSNDLVLKASKVSRQHAAINKYKDQYIIIDLKSSNGVFVNGRKCDEHTLQEGDQISIGGYKFVFQKA